MKDNVEQWIIFAEENLNCARLVANNGYYNPSLQNAQQATEKALKALILHIGLEFRKTHSIQELKNIATNKSAGLGLLTDEECELLDSIYLPSKYPLVSVLPDSEPNLDVCNKCIAIADNVIQQIKNIIDNADNDIF